MHPIGYHIVKTAYGQWLPGDPRGHWSGVWDPRLGKLTTRKLNPGSKALRAFARGRMKASPVQLSPKAIDAVFAVLAKCESQSEWSVVAATVEPTHMHLLISYGDFDPESTCRWIARETTKRLRCEIGGQGRLWAKGKWCEVIEDNRHWDAVVDFIVRHPHGRCGPFSADAIRGLEQKQLSKSNKTYRPYTTVAFQGADDLASSKTGDDSDSKRVPRAIARPLTILSGGQTGVDRAALDFAIAHGLPHGGWCPRGRMAEDGPIDPRYQLRQTPSRRYAERTEWNLRDADATLVISPLRQTTGGTRLTLQLAKQYAKPVLHLTGESLAEASGAALRGFLDSYRVATLNVAGPRASQASEVEQLVWKILQLGIPTATPVGAAEQLATG